MFDAVGIKFAGQGLKVPNITYIVVFILLSIIVDAIAIYFAAKLVSRSSTAGKAVFVAVAAPIYFTLLITGHHINRPQYLLLNE